MCFLLSTCFVSFLKECKWSFLYLCNSTLRTEVCDGANCWLTMTMWCAKPTLLSYFIQRSYYCPCSSTVLDCYLAVSLFQSSLPVVTQWLWCTLYCVLWVTYEYFIPFFFNCLVQPVYWADYFLGIFMFFGTLLEYTFTRISYIWFDSTKFLPWNGFPSCPCVGIRPVLMVLSVKLWSHDNGTSIEFVIAIKKRKYIVKHKLKSTENLTRFFCSFFLLHDSPQKK